MAHPTSTAAPPRAWPPAVLAVAAAAGYAVFLVLPYVVNGLAAYPLADVAAGSHDPHDLWPRAGGPLGPVFALGGLATLLLGPWLAGAALLWALGTLWQRRRSADVAGLTILLVAVAVSAGTLLWLTTPLAHTLVGWTSD